MTGLPGREDNRTDRTRRAILLALLAGTLATVFILPRYVSSPWIAGPDTAGFEPVESPPSEPSPSRTAEMTRYRQESQDVLAEVIASRDRLQARQVETWAQNAFHEAMELVGQGDERYGRGEYDAALDRYRQARESLAELEQLSRDTLQSALADGEQAIESLDPNAAAAASDLARRIAPEDAEVQVLTGRVATLPALRALMAEGERAIDDGRPEAAVTSYRKAMDLDPLHQGAAAALAASERALAEARFSRHMSRGFAALDDGEFDQARQAFEEAGGIFPERAAVRQALGQVANERAHAQVERTLGRAAELENREQWQEAQVAYESLLAQDPTLTDTKVRLIRVRARAELDRRIARVFDDPLALSQASNYRAAQDTLADARGIAQPGPRLRSQVERLETMLERAAVPVKVVFESDNQTRVTLFRVAELGRFERTTLELRPGRYVAAGTRRGYRDVRVEFTITGAPRDEPIVVRCVEPI